MIIHLQGNLLESDCDVIGHQCNCQMAYGAGIALQIKLKYPKAYQVFLSDDRKPEDKLGKYTIYDNLKDKTIFNLYGQLDCGYGKVFTDYQALRHALAGMMQWVILSESIYEIKLKVGLPYKIGCGLAGGDWEIVEKIIEEISNSCYHDIYVYEYQP